MAPLPYNNTGIYFVDYSVGDAAHTMQIRIEDQSLVPDAAELVNDILVTFGTNLANDFTIEGARYQAPGANFSLPALPPNQPTVGAAAIGGVNIPRFISWVGRGSDTARRVRLYLYGVVFGTPDDYRLTGTELQAAADTVQLLRNTSPNVATTIAGDEPIWSPYANVGYNSYWERERRG